MTKRNDQETKNPLDDEQKQPEAKLINAQQTFLRILARHIFQRMKSGEISTKIKDEKQNRSDVCVPKPKNS